MTSPSEKLVICPYNKAHAILQHRMQVHLHKCRQSHKDLDWGYCSHNATHHMPRLELEYHERNECPDRLSFQRHVIQFESGPSLAPIDRIDLPEPEENWDDEEQSNTFDPRKNAAEKSLIRGTHCVPPAERKAFRLEHRQRVQEREEGAVKPHYVPPAERKASGWELEEGAAKSQPQPTGEVTSIENSLRRPKELPKGFVMGRGMSRTSHETKSDSPAPGTLDDFPNLSLHSNGGSTSSKPSVPNGLMMGFGRGKAMGSLVDSSGTAGSSSSAPVMSAWGRGRPKF